MIISHQHRFIFLKTEKTAGTSLEIALSGICGPDDIITPISKEDELHRKELGFRGAQNYQMAISDYGSEQLKALIGTKKDRKQKLGFYNHISATEVKARIDPKIWSDYFKFCFERNPFDKFLSWYAWRNKNQEFESMKAFIASGEAIKINGSNVYTIDEEVVVDKVYQFEALEEAILDLNRRFGLEGELKLPDYKYKSGYRGAGHYRESLTTYEIDWINNVYKKEISELGYQF